jgi:glycosyltransferase involved in cell wall biosynthesis
MVLDIALPFHGDVDLFKDSVRSVLFQDSSEWRLIIINDAHPDLDVDKWVQGLNDTRITYIRNDTNLGPSKNYTKCLELVQNEYCMIFGADDLLAKNFVSEISNAIKASPDSDLYHPCVNVIDAKSVEYLPQVDRIKKLLMPKSKGLEQFTARQVMPSIMTGNWMYFPAIVWKSETAKKFGFRHDLNVCQDIWLISEILIAGGKLTIVPEDIFNYRRFSGSDSSIKLLNGIRFKEEKKAFYGIAKNLSRNKMYFSAFAARLHLTSRLHALSLIPQALIKRASIKPILVHLFL